MYNISNLTHRTLQLSEDLSIAPNSAIKFEGTITSNMARLNKLGLIAVTEAQPRKDKINTPMSIEDMFIQVERQRAEHAAAEKKSTKKKS